MLKLMPVFSNRVRREQEKPSRYHLNPETKISISNESHQDLMTHWKEHNDASVVKTRDLNAVLRREQTDSNIERITKIIGLDSSKNCQVMNDKGRKEGNIWQNLIKVCGLGNKVFVPIA